MCLLQNTSISNDAPESFINPEVVPIPANRIDDAAAFVIGRRVPPRQEPFAVSQILPGGQGIKDATLAATISPLSPYRTYPYGKQVRTCFPFVYDLELICALDAADAAGQ